MIRNIYKRNESIINAKLSNIGCRFDDKLKELGFKKYIGRFNCIIYKRGRRTLIYLALHDKLHMHVNNMCEDITNEDLNFLKKNYDNQRSDTSQ